MGSATDHRPPAVALAALIGSAVLFAFGTGLQPVWWLTWLAPIPVLLVAPRMSAVRAASVAAAAHLLGMAGFARYLLAGLAVPIPVVAAVLVVTAGVFAGVVLLFRALVRRGRPILAVLAAPAMWSGAEYLIAALTPFGSNWAVANSQADALPVLQVVAVTGPWGVAFVVLAVACAIGVLAAPALERRVRLRAAGVGALALVGALGFGTARLALPDDPVAEPVRVSLVAAPTPVRQPHAGTPAGRALLDADLDRVRSLAPGGTDLVVFPEKDLVVDDATLPGVLDRFSAAARAEGVTLVLGVEQHSGAIIRNTALTFPADGSPPIVYHKQYPVPGVEDEVTAGVEPVSALTGPPPRIGTAICADLGRPALGRAYGSTGIGLLAVPALDFTVDAWSQSRVQSLRGAENGYAVARAARAGFLTVTDARGRVLAQEVATDGRAAAVTVDVPLQAGGTPYTRFGDWFAWLCLVTALLGVVLAGPVHPAVGSREPVGHA
ncbi:nitrilase-related carbon-nitrogen hydrolase [Pseudonocardia cypriaca]|uniref:Apolipoprotein N-acyltransferase n=1 Tax=Pseudonocardia cypriaca TaxID=882449 RepID=A0A543GIU1_9PSEU|nr:nitrilase-related carbon-nitrogen hydrolase [Pseudonocardia cypriaca]TQM45955.1 apolipoprotein N-acyltransferase [Pseudonocardia cypriaca]